MQREALEQLIEEHKSIRKIAKAAGVSYATIRHWLRKHGLKSKGILNNIKPRKHAKSAALWSGWDGPRRLSLITATAIR